MTYSAFSARHKLPQSACNRRRDGVPELQHYTYLQILNWQINVDNLCLSISAKWSRTERTTLLWNSETAGICLIALDYIDCYGLLLSFIVYTTTFILFIYFLTYLSSLSCCFHASRYRIQLMMRGKHVSDSNAWLYSPLGWRDSLIAAATDYTMIVSL